MEAPSPVWSPRTPAFRGAGQEGGSTPKPGRFWGPLPKCSPVLRSQNQALVQGPPSTHPRRQIWRASLGPGAGHRFCGRKPQFLSKPAVCAGPPSGLGLKMKTARHPHTGPPPQNQSPVRGPLVGLVPKRKASSKPEGGGGPPSKPRRRPGPYYPPHASNPDVSVTKRLDTRAAESGDTMLAAHATPANGACDSRTTGSCDCSVRFLSSCDARAGACPQTQKRSVHPVSAGVCW